jgi:glycosyltransferase involved in cell wall biosynthesis
MRGIFRSLQQPGSYAAVAVTNFTLNGITRKQGEIFEFTGDPTRLQGLAEIRLFPAASGGSISGLTWLSPFSQSDGYGSLAEEAVLGLLKQKLDVAIGNIGWVDTYNVAPAIRERLSQPIHMYDLALVMTPPDDGMVSNRNLLQEFHLAPIFKKQFRILYTMFETDTLPKGWDSRINNGVDAVFVPSKFMLESFRNGGVTVPLYHTPAGIDTQMYKPSPRQRSRWAGTPKDDQVRFLMCGTLTRRKNVAGAVEAFQEAAGDNPNWSLVIKTQPGHPEFEEFVSSPVRLASDSRIKLITERYNRDQMVALYHISDVFVWPSFGEGIGLPPQEAMSCGLEVVAGAHSGALDYIDATRAYPVEADLVKALEFKSMHHEDDWGDVGNWWRPRHDDLVKQMRLAAEAVGKKARGSKARDWMVANRGQDVTAHSILKTINEQIVPLLK